MLWLWAGVHQHLANREVRVLALGVLIQGKPFTLFGNLHPALNEKGIYMGQKKTGIMMSIAARSLLRPIWWHVPRRSVSNVLMYLCNLSVVRSSGISFVGGDFCGLHRQKIDPITVLAFGASDSYTDIAAALHKNLSLIAPRAIYTF